MKQPTLPMQRISTAPTHPQQTRKIPLLPTPPASARQFNNRNHYRQFIPRPSPPRHNINSTFSGPLTLNNNRFHQQPHILGQHQQIFTPRPYPQPQGHQSPALLPLPSHQIPAFSDHTNMYQDMQLSRHSHTYQCSYHIQIISSAHYHTCMQYRNKLRGIEDTVTGKT